VSAADNQASDGIEVSSRLQGPLAAYFVGGGVPRRITTCDERINDDDAIGA